VVVGGLGSCLGRGPGRPPAVGKKSVELLLGVRAGDSRQHVDQIFGGLDAVGNATADERVQTREVSSSSSVPDKEVVLPSQPTLGAVVMDRDPSIGQEELKTRALVERVAERALRQDTRAQGGGPF
jgi:hypothetical protein